MIICNIQALTPSECLMVSIINDKSWKYKLYLNLDLEGPVVAQIIPSLQSSKSQSCTCRCKIPIFEAGTYRCSIQRGYRDGDCGQRLQLWKWVILNCNEDTVTIIDYPFQNYNIWGTEILFRTINVLKLKNIWQKKCCSIQWGYRDEDCIYGKG